MSSPMKLDIDWYLQLVFLSICVGLYIYSSKSANYEKQSALQEASVWDTQWYRISYGAWYVVRIIVKWPFPNRLSFRKNW